MTGLTFSQALTIVTVALDYGRERLFAPLAVAVLDARAALKAFGADDDVPLAWGDIAVGKARGSLMMGVNSRQLGEQALERLHFIAAVTHVAGGSLVPVAGGVLIRVVGRIAGAVGIAGGTSDNNEAAALAGIAAAVPSG